MRTTLCVLLLTGAAALTTSSIHAQQKAAAPSSASQPEIDLALTYAADRSTPIDSSGFWRQGGALELSAEAYRGLGIAMNIEGSRVANIQGSGVNLTTVTTTFGPRYTWLPRSRKIAVFGQALIGESHGLDSTFPSPSGAQTDFNTFALQIGGGLDLRLSRHLAVRALQADWVRTQFANGTNNIQNSLRLSAGIVLRFPS